MNRSKKTFSLLFVITILLTLLGGCTDTTSSHHETIEDLEGKTFGVQLGSILDGMVKDAVPGANVLYFNTFPDQIVALQTGKIDAIPCPQSILSNYYTQDPNLKILDGVIGHIDVGFVFPKNEKGNTLRLQMNEFLAELKESGEQEQIISIWEGSDESEKVVENYKTLPNINGKLTFVTEGSYPPMDYYKDGVMVGYDVDLAIRFAKKYGYALDIVAMNFDALMPALESGRIDFGASGIVINEERAKSVYFSDPDLSDPVLVAIYQNQGSSVSFFTGFKNSFRRTFLDENRYQLFLQGIGTTMWITILSILFGTVFGFILYQLSQKGYRIVTMITGALTWFIQGLPNVVLLMILYYVIFSKLKISALLVSVIAFTLTFGTSVYGNLTNSIMTIPPGQYEAAASLGLGQRHTFFDIILPQASRTFLPTYKADIVSLIKATAVVGYITVQDLTKMADIVRSRTYEAMVPLIATAILYFLLMALLNHIVSRITFYSNPKRRNKQQILRRYQSNDQN